MSFVLLAGPIHADKDSKSVLDPYSAGRTADALDGGTATAKAQEERKVQEDRTEPPHIEASRPINPCTPIRALVPRIECLQKYVAEHRTNDPEAAALLLVDLLDAGNQDKKVNGAEVSISNGMIIAVKNDSPRLTDDFLLSMVPRVVKIGRSASGNIEWKSFLSNATLDLLELWQPRVEKRLPETKREVIRLRKICARLEGSARRASAQSGEKIDRCSQLCVRANRAGGGSTKVTKWLEAGSREYNQCITSHGGVDALANSDVRQACESQGVIACAHACEGQ